MHQPGNDGLSLLIPLKPFVVNSGTIQLRVNISFQLADGFSIAGKSLNDFDGLMTVAAPNSVKPSVKLVGHAYFEMILTAEEI